MIIETNSKEFKLFIQPNKWVEEEKEKERIKNWSFFLLPFIRNWIFDEKKR